MTTIQVSDSIWQILNQMKMPGESFNKMVEKLIENYEEKIEDEEK